LPLLACHERQQRGRLAQVAREQGGLIVALDGLAPQGGEPQISHSIGFRGKAPQPS